MALGGSNDIDIKIRVDDGGVVTILDAAGEAVKKSGEKAEKAGEGFSKAEAKIVSLNAAMELAKKAFEGAKIALEFASKGNAIDDAAESFERLSISAGATSDVLLNQLQQATKGTVSNFNLFKSANDAMQAGLKPDQIVLLSDAAKKLSRQVGQDTTTAFNNLTQAIETGRVGMLKQYNIIIDTDTVIGRYANSIGKLASEIDPATALQLTQAEAIKKTAAALADVGPEGESAGASAEVFSVALQNASDSMATAINRSTALATALNTITGVVTTLISDFDSFEKNLDLIGTKGFAALKFDFLTAMKGKLQELSDIPLLGRLVDTTALDQNIKDAESYIRGLIKVDTEAAKTENDNSDKLIEEARKRTEAKKKEFEQSLKERESIRKHQEEIAAAREEQKKYREELEKLKTPQGMLEAQKSFVQTIADCAELNKSLEDQDIILDQIIQHWMKVGLSASQATALAIDGLDKQIEKIDEALAKLKEGQGFQVGKTGFGEAIVNAFGGDGQKYGALGEQIGASILQGVQAAFSAKTGKDWQKVSASFASSIANAISPGSGQFVGPLVDGIFGLFMSGDSAATKDRKALDKYLADLFEVHHIQAIINGQIAQIKDIDFSGSNFGNRDAGFFAAFDKLPEKAAGAFSAVGQALAALTNTSMALSGNFAAAIATNMGGSLNNLQQLIVATGLSFGQFGDALWAAFNKGELSAMQLEEALMRIKSLMTQGIPGAVGAVDQAWKNMQIALAAGPKGAQALIDSIGDIAAEANELRIKSLPALRAAMINNFGISADAADKFFIALKVAGIKSFDDLKNASKETLLAIAANLEALQKGLAATFGVVTDPTKAATTPGISHSSSGGSSGPTAAQQAAETKKQQLKAQQEAIDQLAHSTKDYQVVLDQLTAGTISGTQAQALFLGFQAKATELYKAQQKAIKDLEDARAHHNKAAIAAALLEAANAQNAIQAFQNGASGLGQQIQNGQFLLPSSFNVKVDAGGLDIRDISQFVHNLNELPLTKTFTLKVAVNGSDRDKRILQGVFNSNVGPGQASR